MSLTTVARYRDLPTAELARSRLEAEGIEAVLLDRNLVAQDWLVSNAIGGVRLQVPAEEAARAREILAEDGTADLAATFEGSLPPAKDEVCPSCGSERVRGSRLATRTKALSLLLSIPFVLWSRRTRCLDCGHRWR
jgi:hypothetical protein